MNELSIFEIIFIATLFFYILQQVFFIIGFKKKHKLNNSGFGTVTVIVAARNEQQNIASCINSLKGLNYPKDKLQIIIVDDFSTDNTGPIIDELIIGNSNFLKINPHEKIASLSGKANAIGNAIKVATGDIIITTDADCIVCPEWVNDIVKHYTKDVGVVCGFTFQKTHSVFSGIQNLDWVYLLTVAAGTINLNIPLSCIGNNMSYRKTAYEEIGGYEKLKFSVTEDFALLHTIHNQTDYKIIYINEPTSLVTSEPCKTIKELFQQKHRWGRGGMDSDIIGYLVMAWGFFCHLFFFLQFLFLSKLTITLTLIKILSDLLFLSVPLSHFKSLNKLKYFIQFEIYFIIYVLLLPFVVFAKKKVIWKERKY